MIDSHTHLDSCAPDDADLVAAAVEAGVSRLVTIDSLVGTAAALDPAALARSER